MKVDLAWPDVNPLPKRRDTNYFCECFPLFNPFSIGKTAGSGGSGVFVFKTGATCNSNWLYGAAVFKNGSKKKKDFDNWVENSQDPGLDSLKAEAQKLAESFDVVE